MATALSSHAASTDDVSMNQPSERQSAHVLIVDDMATSRALACFALPEPDYIVTEAANGTQALQLIEENDFDVILLDVLMPDMNGLEVCEQVRQMSGKELLPIIMLTSLEASDDVVKGMEVGASEYLNKPFNAAELRARIDTVVRQKRLTDRLDDAESVLFSLARMVEARDQNTGAHCDRLSHMGVVFGKKLGLDENYIEALRRGGVLHDIGKLGIPDAVLLKPGKLNDDEWVIMRRHVTIGAELCSPLQTMASTVDIVKYHHERWDGTGYPDNLAGEDIPLLARVFQILDIYDALSAERPYKKSMPMEKIMAILQEETDKGFRDPRVMKEFLSVLRNEPHILKMSETKLNPQEERAASIAKKVHELGFQSWSEQPTGSD